MAAPLSDCVRLSRALTKHLAADFTKNGVELIAQMRKDKPLDYLKLITAILQKDENGEAAGSASYNVIERRIIMPEPRDT